MSFRRLLPFHKFSRPATAGLGLVVLASMFSVDGCLTPRKLTGIYVEPSGGACISPASSAQFTAYGLFTSSGHAAKTENITDSVTWTTDLSEVATVSSTGLATSGTSYVGLTNVKATADGEFGIIWSTAPLTVSTGCVSGSGAIITGIRILPGDQNLASIGDTLQAVAVGHYSGAPWSRDLSEKAQWTSSNPEIAKVAPGGLITAVGTGEAAITVTTTSERGTPVTNTIKVVVGGASTN